MEILSPAGSLEAVKAALMSGADAIYMGYSDFNARRNAKNFTHEEFLEAINLCNLHGVHVYITLNILLNDRELVKCVDFIKELSNLNITAVIIQDLGVLELVKKVSPSLPCHASTQLTVHNLEGALKAKELGFTRVVLSRELSFKNIKYITENADIETEVFVHGALCMSYSGQCYLSSVIGQRSGNRGLCAQPCRLPYSYDDNKKSSHPLSLKDLSLVHHVKKLKEIGVSCLKIEGRMKRPEYTALVTKTYKTIADEERLPTKDEISLLEKVFSRDGFTDGYFTHKIDDKMFGIKGESSDLSNIYENITANYKERKYPVSFEFFMKSGKPSKLIAKTSFGFVEVFGSVPEIALNRPTSKEQIETLLLKTGNTIFECTEINIEIDDGLMLRAKDINALRRDALEKLTDKKFSNFSYKTTDYSPKFSHKNHRNMPKYTVEITSLSQISDFMYKEKPETLYIPLEVVCENLDFSKGLLDLGFNIVLRIPKIAMDDEYENFTKILNKAKNIGIKGALVSNVGFLNLDFEIYGDIGLNFYNSMSMELLKNLKRQTISFELKTAQIRDLEKPTETEILAYGKLPLMIFENCAIKRNEGRCTCKEKTTYLSDRKGEKFALLPEFGCRNTLINSKPLYILDKISDFTNLGIDTFRLYFTTENKSEADEIYKAYVLGKDDLKLDFTRGLYYRGTL